MTIRPLSESLPIQLLAVHDRVMQYFRPMLHKYRVTDQQWRVLRAIAAGETDFRALSEICLIQPASLSRMLDTLQGRGLVDRRVDKRDKRQRVVTLTAPGQTLFDDASAETEKIYRSLEEDLGGDYARFIDTLRDLNARLGSSDFKFAGRDDRKEQTTGPQAEPA